MQLVLKHCQIRRDICALAIPSQQSPVYIFIDVALIQDLSLQKQRGPSLPAVLLLFLDAHGQLAAYWPSPVDDA